MEKAFIFGKRDDDVEEFVSLDDVSTVRPMPDGRYTVSLRSSGHTYSVRDLQQRYSFREIEEWSRGKFLGWTNWRGENGGAPRA